VCVCVFVRVCVAVAVAPGVSSESLQGNLALKTSIFVQIEREKCETPENMLLSLSHTASGPAW